MKKTIQVSQQEIRSLLQNFNWETNEDWYEVLLDIQIAITEYWEIKRK